MPALSTAQSSRARQTNRDEFSTPVQIFERHYPVFKRLRQQSTALAKLQQNSATALNQLELNKQRMLLEGQLLALSPKLHFQDLNVLLNLDQRDTLPQVIPYADALDALVDEVERLFNVPTSKGGVPSANAVYAAFDTAFTLMAKHVDGHAALYHEVLKKTTLNEQERGWVKSGLRALEDMAQQWFGTIQTRLLKHCLSTASARLFIAKHDRDTFNALPEDAPDRAQQILAANISVQEWQDIHIWFVDAEHNFSQSGPLHNSIDNLRLEANLDKLDAQSRGLFTYARVFAGNAVAQGMASMLHFVLARAYVEPGLLSVGFASRTAASGASIGAVHETLDNFVKPAVKEVMASLGAPDLRKITPKEVIAELTLATTRDGLYHEFNDQERATMQEDVNTARSQFILAQNDFYNGTLKGDIVTFGAQGGAQMTRQLIDLTTATNASGLIARMMSSFVGGAMMSGIQSMHQQSRRFEYQGRQLPTHVPQQPSLRLQKRLESVVTAGLRTVDPREANARLSYASKMYSAMEGMVGYNGFGLLAAKLDTGTTSGIIGSVLLTGLQAIGLLAPFYANKQSKGEAFADGTGRFSSAMKNIRNPDRATLPHAAPADTVSRQIENSYHRLRGLQQAIPQAGAELSEALVHTMAEGVTSLASALSNPRLRQRAAPHDLEMGEYRENGEHE